MIAIQDGHIPKRHEIEPQAHRDRDPLDDSLLGAIPIEVVEALGEEAVIEMQKQEIYLGWMETVLERGNPFAKEGLSEVNLNFLGASARHKLETYRSKDSKYEPLKRNLQEISTRARMTGLASLHWAEEAQDEMNAVAGQEIDLAQAVTVLHEVAAKVPYPATIKTICNMYSFIADNPKLGYCLLPEDPMWSQVNFMTPEAVRVEAEAIKEGVDDIREGGRANFDRLLNQIEPAQVDMATGLLKSLDAAGDRLLSQIPDPGSPEDTGFVVKDMFTVDDYLRAKAAVAIKVIETRRPELLSDPDLSAVIRRFSLQETEEVAEEKRGPRDNQKGLERHRVNTINARDILKGGSRLLTKKDKGTDLEAMAKGLHDKKKQHELSYAEMGLLVAAVKGKKIAEEFLRTCKLAVDIQTNQIRSKALSEVYAVHPMVYVELSQLDPRQMVKNIGTVLRNANDELATLFAPYHEDLEELFIEQQLLPRQMRDKQ